MFQVSVKGNVKERMADLDGQRRELQDKAVMRALNRTVENVRAEAVRRLRDSYNIKAGVIRDQMTLRTAWSGNLKASVVANGKPIPLYEFSPRWSPRDPGASFEVRRGTRKTLAHTFVARMKSGHKGVFERIGKSRLPIEEKFSIGVPGMFGAKAVQEALEVIGRSRFVVNLNQQIDYLFKR